MDFPAKFICATKDYSGFSKLVPAPYLRKEFILDSVPENAELLISGLGFYELYINGKNITKGLLAPYISNPDHIVYYDSYDITKNLKKGKNAVAVILGNGMKNCPGGIIWDFDKEPWRGAPCMALAIEADGKIILSTDESFKTHPSPILFDDLRCGVFYDARLEIKNFSEPDFCDNGWDNALYSENPRGEKKLCGAEVIKVYREVTPVSVTPCNDAMIYPGYRDVLPTVKIPDEFPHNDGYIYDFGINSAGIFRLKIKGTPGQKISIQFAERMHDGKLDMRAMSFLPERFNQRCEYTCRGGEEEVFEPSFCYFGFRYALVSGITEQQAVPELLTSLLASSSLENRGGFECSDKTLNALQACIRNTDLANFYYFPTDCPHREKNGWTGDAALSCEQMMLNFATDNSLSVWLDNIMKAQHEDGQLPGIVPTGTWGYEWGCGPGWDAILTLAPYYTIKYTGKTEMARKCAPSILRYLNYIISKRDEKGLLHYGLGDWCQARRLPIKAPLEFTDTVICYIIADKAHIIFKTLGMTLQDHFAIELRDSIYESIRKHLISSETATALGNCQATQALAINYGLFTEDEMPRAKEVMLRQIDEQDGLIDFGMMGNRAFYRMMSKIGETDKAIEMITTPKFPSFAYWLNNGATTIYESFFKTDESPDSENHHAWGDVSAWMIKCLAGICQNPLDDDCDSLLINPHFTKKLTYADGYHISNRGKITSRWDGTNGKYTLRVHMPDGMHGTASLSDGALFADGQTEKKLVCGDNIFEGIVYER